MQKSLKAEVTSCVHIDNLVVIGDKQEVIGNNQEVIGDIEDVIGDIQVDIGAIREESVSPCPLIKHRVPLQTDKVGSFRCLGHQTPFT